MKTKKIVSLVLAISIVGSTFILSSFDEVDETLKNATAIAEKLFSVDKIKEEDDKEKYIASSYIKGLDGEESYILSESIAGGYAIFEKESMELIEYSAVGSSPYDSIVVSERSYAGPGSYFEEEEEYFKDIKTKKKVSKETGKQYAKRVKDKLKKDREKRKEEAKKEKNTSTSNSINSARNSDPGPTGDAIVDADSYQILSQVHIPNYQFFVGNNWHGYNDIGTCTTIATQLLLAYNNWANDGRLLRETETMENKTVFLSGRDSKEEEPYAPERIGTTSSIDDEQELTFYETLRGYINPDWFPNNGDDLGINIGAHLYEAFDGIKNYLYAHSLSYTVSEIKNVLYWDENLSQIENTLQDNQIAMSYASYDMSKTVMKNRVIYEIDNGRPVIASIKTYEGSEEDDSHAVVIYGYQTINYQGIALDGFIAHWGWRDEVNDLDSTSLGKKKEDTHVWFNSSWITSYLTFAMGHQHTDATYPGNNHILKCATCNRTTATGQHTYAESCEKINIINGIEIKSHDYHNDFCSCGYYIGISRHELVYQIHTNSSSSGTVSSKHIAQCFCGYIDERGHFSEGLYFIERLDSKNHLKVCICSLNSETSQRVTRREAHTFKNGATCMFCGELNTEYQNEKGVEK